MGWADAPPYHYHGTRRPQPPGESGGARSLWIGGLQHWMNEDYLYSCFTESTELVSLVIKRNKQTGQSEGFGFLNFADHTTADLVLRSYNGQDMPNTHQEFKLNWATQQDAPQIHTDDDSDHAIFVGDLAFDVTDFMLYHLFKTRYPSVKGAKVIFDKVTGRSKSYGFVFFGDVNEHMQAMTEMNGAYCSTRPMRIRPALNKKTLRNTQGTDSDQDPTNSKIFVGCLGQSVTDEDLKQAFSPYGELVDVKILAGKHCGFVTYSNRASAEEAIRVLNGSKLGCNTIRLSYGRRSANKQDHRNDGNNGCHQSYDPSGFGWCPQDPYACTQIGNPGYGYYQLRQAPVQ
ncbi:polyadenylate-binding protein RBP45-like [Phragmites australis]|uniref:polyadenylate-binding protein RBP45-like n=1 Tax=Phragmites australis TaxID=29695 RepID=UPI002D785375|nr:polyadenylate-binding protein RBP45-like [Phragmites australis]